MIAVRHTLTAELVDKDLVTFDGFVSPSTCRRMLNAIPAAAWMPSHVGLNAPGPGAAPAAGRSSSTIVLLHPTEWMALALRRIERSLLSVFGIDPAHLEPWQATRYKHGQAYDYHLDCGCWRGHPSGERKRTVLIYIEQPVRGGATHFRALGKRVPAVAGRLVVWNNLLDNGNCNHAMIHSGRPVWQGRKTILTSWEREGRVFRQSSGGTNDK